ALLTLDHLMRGLRGHKDSTQNCRRILETIFPLLRARTLVWVPQAADEAVLLHGEAWLTPGDCRHPPYLLSRPPDWQPPAPLLVNPERSTDGRAASPWESRLPQVGNVLAFLITDPRPLGWVIAVNKYEESRADDERKSRPSLSPFRRRDAALLT